MVSHFTEEITVSVKKLTIVNRITFKGEVAELAI
jgi:hypothetical protein